MVRFLEQGRSLTVGDICSNSRVRHATAIPLLVQRGADSHLRPKSGMALAVGDEVLLCGRRNSSLLAQRFTDNIELLDSLVNENPHYIPLLRWISRLKTKRKTS